jgi:hypothetical protein
MKFADEAIKEPRNASLELDLELIAIVRLSGKVERRLVMMDRLFLSGTSLKRVVPPFLACGNHEPILYVIIARNSCVVSRY